MSEMTFIGKLCAWGRLLRLPNLFTAPWDPVCGFLIAGGASDPEKIGYLAVAALCAYAFGLVTNDIADLKTDTAERPARPLPSGEISMKEASIAAVVLCIVALELTSFAGHGACFGMMLLLVVILLYNYCGRKSALLSSALMGLCRVFSFGIGVAAIYPEIPSLNMTLCALYAAGMFLFILGITLVARRETETLKSRPGRTLIPARSASDGGFQWCLDYKQSFRYGAFSGICPSHTFFRSIGGCMVCIWKNVGTRCRSKEDRFPDTDIDSSPVCRHTVVFSFSGNCGCLLSSFGGAASLEILRELNMSIGLIYRKTRSTLPGNGKSKGTAEKRMVAQPLDKGICHYCGKKFKPEELSMDHVVPVARGGRSNKGNIVPCCKDCNNKKKYLTPVEMILAELERKNDFSE